MLEDIPDGGRRNMRKLLGGRDDNCFDIGRKTAVRIGDRPLRFKIDHIPYPTHDMMDSQFATGINGQAVILDDGNT